MTPYEQVHGDRGKEKLHFNRKKIVEGPDSGTDAHLLLGVTRRRQDNRHTMGGSV